MSKTGILILGHGSSYEYNKKIIGEQAERLRNMGFENVYIGFNERCRPYIEDSMKQMADDGIDRVIAVPFFIASGLHMTRDIPPKLGLPENVKSGTSTRYGKDMEVFFDEPFGKDPMLTEILADKYRMAVTKGMKSAAIVIGHGSRLPFNKEVIETNSQRLNEMGIKAYAAFNELNTPTIEEVLDRMIADGAEEIVALPLFISAGDHLKNDLPAKLHVPDFGTGEFEQDGRKVRMHYLTPIGTDPRLTNVLAAKIRKAIEA